MSKRRLIITSILSIFFSAVLLIGSTYSIFTSQEIDETANVYKTGNLEVKYATSSSVQSDPIPKNEEEADGITPYRITVTNTGNVPYQFDVILTDTTSSTDNTINYQYIMTKVGYLDTKPLSECTNNIIKEDVILLAGEAVDIDIRVWISDTVSNSELGKSFYAKLSIDGQAVYNDSKEINNDMLSLRYMDATRDVYSNPKYFRSDMYKTYVKTASFVDYIDTSNASIDTDGNKILWNMTTNTTHNTNKVIAWLEDNGTTDGNGNRYYDLYIGSKEKVYARSLRSFFNGMTALENIIFDNLDTSLTTNISEMFYGGSSLISLDLSRFDTSNVTDMGSMFSGCSSLVALDVGDFDTSNVTNMNNMFSGCSSLISLDLSGFDTSNVTKMYNMFNGCNSLISLDLSGFDTSSVTDMIGMFCGCSSLVKLDVSDFDTSNVTNMFNMFYGCSSLTNLDLSGFDTSNVTSMYNMFNGCNSLISLDLSNFNTIKVTNMQHMFYNCSRIITILTIRNSNIDYTNIFYNSATITGAKITLNYTIETESLVDSMIETKSTNSNVVKGTSV